MFRSIAPLLVALSIVAWPTAALSNPVTAAVPGTANTILVKPLTLINTSSLDYGRLIVNGAGTAVIDPDANTETVTGGVTRAGGGFSAASFTGAASGLSLIVVLPPAGPITLTRAGGSETMLISNVKLQGGIPVFGNAIVYLATSAGAFSFRVGGTLSVAAAQADGTYTGTFNITATYY